MIYIDNFGIGDIMYMQHIYMRGDVYEYLARY